MNNKKTYMTGAQSTGKLHLGNLLGSILNIKKYNEERVLIMAADLHSLTTNSQVSYKNSIDLLRYYHSACPQGLFFIQSQFPQISHLAWILSTYTGVGKLMQMTQYKSKINQSNNNCGLLTYPILMAADVVISQADFIPVGIDQAQHLEFARDIVKNFNSQNAKKLIVPKTIVSITSKVFDLQNPEKKMSKSNNPRGTIFLDDNIETVLYKIKKAKTDSFLMPDCYKEARTAINKLLNLYSTINKIPLEELYIKFGNKKIIEFKTDLARTLSIFLEKNQPILSFEEMENLIKKQRIIINNQFNSVVQKVHSSIFVN